MIGSIKHKASMAIHQTKGKSDLEKRFRQLRAQVYGQSHPTEQTPSTPRSSAYSISSVAKLVENQAGTKTADISDMQHLYTSVTKIALLTSLAIGAELLLYFMTNSKIINLKF